MNKLLSEKNKAKSSSSVKTEVKKIPIELKSTPLNNDSLPTKKKMLTASELRIQRDITELSLPKNITIDFPHVHDLTSFHVYIIPQEGFYKRGRFEFSFKIKDSYPYDPPKVKLLQKIYHPNIDLSGNVCLNILREDWKPILSLSSVILGLQILFLDPNSEDPLNKDAALVLASNPQKFQQNVTVAMRGGVLSGERYDDVVSQSYYMH